MPRPQVVMHEELPWQSVTEYRIPAWQLPVSTHNSLLHEYKEQNQPCLHVLKFYTQVGTRNHNILTLHGLYCIVAEWLDNCSVLKYCFIDGVYM